MRLAVFTSKYPARVATFFERDIRALVEAGIEVDVFSISPLDAARWRYSLEILNERVLPRERVHHLTLIDAVGSLRPWPPQKVGTFLKRAAVILASAARFGPEPFAKSAYVMPKAWAWSRRLSGPYDHILGYWGNYSATCAYLYHQLTDRRVPFSIWLHAGTDLYFRTVFLQEKLLYADSIITCCEFNRRYITESFPDIADAVAGKIRVCYHGLDLAEFPFRVDGRPPNRLITVGRLSSEKGFDYLLRAVGVLVNRGVDVQVEMVGDGPERQRLQSLAQMLGIRERVTFRGWLPFPDVRAAIQGATILVHPSAGLGDGLPNVIREAMALGTPVIASSVAGIPEALDDGRCGILTSPRDVAGLASAVEQLLGDATLRCSLAERARRRTEAKFDLWRNGAWLADHLRQTTRGEGATHSHQTAGVGSGEE